VREGSSQQGKRKRKKKEKGKRRTRCKGVTFAQERPLCTCEKSGTVRWKERKKIKTYLSTGGGSGKRGTVESRVL
jgi:hypothetical protein